MAEVEAAKQELKSGKTAGESEMPAISREGVSWLTKVCLVAWKFGKTPNNWQTNVIIPKHKKGNRTVCTNYRRSVLRLPGNVYAKCLEKKAKNYWNQSLKMDIVVFVQVA